MLLTWKFYDHTPLKGRDPHLFVYCNARTSSIVTTLSSDAQILLIEHRKKARFLQKSEEGQDRARKP